jgi:hypothetical protein
MRFNRSFGLSNYSSLRLLIGPEVVCESGMTEQSQSSAVDSATKARLFLSYGRRDAAPLAKRLREDLERERFEVWQDNRQIKAGQIWEQEIRDGLRSTQLVVALLSPHAVRVRDPRNPESNDGVCLDEISFARFAQPQTPIVPVMALPCEPPLCIFRLDYVEMTRWSESEDEYQQGFQRLLNGIESSLQGKVCYRPWESWLRPLDSEAYLAERRQGFIGRQWLFDQIDAWRAASVRERALLILGEPGIGNTALVAQLVHLNPGGQVLAFHCCRADRVDTLEPGRFVQSVAAMIASQLPCYAAQLADGTLADELRDERVYRDAAGAMERGVLDPLERLAGPPDGTRYVLVDALDEALAYRGSGQNLVDLLASRLERLPAWLRVVATSRPEPEILEKLGGLRATVLNAQAEDNRADVDAYIAARLASPNLAERLAATRLTADTAQSRLADAAAGNFLYAKQVLNGLERDQLSFDSLEQLPRGLEGIYHQFFLRVFPGRESFNQARRLLEVVVAAPEPLPGAFLAPATGLNADYEIPELFARLGAFVVAQEEDLIRRYRDYLAASDVAWWVKHYQDSRDKYATADQPLALIDRSPKIATIYSLYHRSLGEWLRSPTNTRFRVSARRGHESLARMCLAERRNGVRAMSVYAFRFLLPHLRQAEMWEEFGEVCNDHPYVQSFIEAGLLSNLVHELLAGIDALKLRPEMDRLPPALIWLYRFGWQPVTVAMYTDGIQRMRYAFGLMLRIVKEDPTRLNWLVALFEESRKECILRGFLQSGASEEGDRGNEASKSWLIHWCRQGLQMIRDAGVKMDPFFSEWLEELEK